MEIKIIAIGKIKDSAYLQKIEEYAKRICHDSKLEIIEIKDADPKTEGERILDHISRDRGRLLALDETGKQYSSIAFAQKLSAISGKVIFIIGGPFGLSDEVKMAADERVALSTLTFTHEMARLLLLEQVYRAISILKKRGYHKV